MHKKGCSESLWIYFKGIAFWNRNVYIELNGKRQNLENKQIKWSSYMFLTSIVICVFMNSDNFYDTLGSTLTLKLS